MLSKALYLGTAQPQLVYSLFHVLEHLDQFKAIKETLLRGLGISTPPDPSPLRLSQKPKFIFLSLPK